MVSVEKIAEDVNGIIKGDSNFVIKGVCDIESGKKHHLTYLNMSENIFRNFGKYGTPISRELFLVGPTQSSISIVLNASGKAGWWNRVKS